MDSNNAFGQPYLSGSLSHLHFTSHIDETLFHELALREHHARSFELSWSSDRASLEYLDEELSLELVWHECRERSERMVLKGKDLLVKADRTWDVLRFQICCGSSQRAQIDSRLRLLFPEKSMAGSAKFRFWFWNSGGNSTANHRRLLEADRWPEVKLNYPAGVRKQLAKVMFSFTPSHGGQLMLWHEDPGTGKTHAIKALAREWGPWCCFEYVCDPERFFGDASYLIEVMLEKPMRGKEWRLLILEDTGELMRADARSEMGQGLSRLLNVVDGLLGQGLKTLLLVTTNERVGRLHPAVARPGRCAPLVEFGSFDRAEAREWLTHHEVDSENEEIPVRISDLFALKHSFANRAGKQRSKVGFQGKTDVAIGFGRA